MQVKMHYLLVSSWTVGDNEVQTVHAQLLSIVQAEKLCNFHQMRQFFRWNVKDHLEMLLWNNKGVALADWTQG